jgi:hypothetical protein
MKDLLKNKIKELESKKSKFRDNEFTGYELESHLDTYIELAKIDGALNVLKNMLIEIIEKEHK